VIGSAHDGRLGAGDEAFLARRVALLAIGIAFVFALFGVRLFQLQIIEGADLRTRSELNAVRTVRIEAPRGEIVDRDGRALAASRVAFGVSLIPNELRDRERTVKALGMLIERDRSELAALVGAPSGRKRFQPVVLESDLAPDAHARVATHRYALPGVVLRTVPRRHYIEGARAAHVLGTIGEIGADELDDPDFAGYRAGEIIGQSGLEARLERHLRGRAGGRNVVVDVQGREVEVLDEVEPVKGGRVVLTLDLDLQRAAEQAFLSEDPEKDDAMGAVVAVDVRNGDVLAIASRPSYDPNAFAGGIDAETWRRLTTDRWVPLQNRALAGQYSPGSTWKAFVAAAGLQEGIVDPQETVYCPGYYRHGNRSYRCWRRGGHGDVDLRTALARSCDVYFYELGIEMGIDRLAHFARGFGFGRPTGIDLPGEAAGLVPDKAWKRRARHEEWITGETVSASIGQGFNLVTPLQLALGYAAIANGGTLHEPRLVRRLETWDGELVEERLPGATRSVPVRAEHLARVREGLVEVVHGERGTGRRAQVPGMTVGGKTGTTQVVSLAALEHYEEEEDIPIHLRDHAWFAAFAPAEDPRIAVAVLAEHGGGGGSVAAPIAQRVLAAWHEKYLTPPPEGDEAAPPDESPPAGSGEPESTLRATPAPRGRGTPPRTRARRSTLPGAECRAGPCVGTTGEGCRARD